MSNAQTITVGTVAVPAFPSSYGDALTVYNSGTVPLYLGDTTGLSVATGFPLSPGSTIGWDKGRALYVVAAAPGGQVTVMTNSGQVNDVSALATAIIDAGLAGDIAQAIFLKGAPTTQGIRAGDRFSPTAFASTPIFAAGTPVTQSLIPAPPVGKCLILCTAALFGTNGSGSGYVRITDSSNNVIFSLQPVPGGSAMNMDLQSLALPAGTGVLAGCQGASSTPTSGIVNVYYAIGDV